MAKVTPGQPITRNSIKALDWNAMQIAAAAHAAGSLSSRIPDNSRLSLDSNTLLIRNYTAGEIPLYHACAIGPPLQIRNYDTAVTSDVLETFKFGRVHWGVNIGAYTLGKFAVLQEPTIFGRLGLAVVSGTTVAQLNVTQNTHDRCDAKLGDTKLNSSYYGSGEILWKEDGIGTKWARIRIGPFVAPVMKAVAAEDIAAGGSGNVTIYLGATATETVVAYLDWMHGGAGISNGDEVLIVFDRALAIWRIIGAESHAYL